MVDFRKNISLKYNAIWEGVRDKSPISKDVLIEKVQNSTDFTEAKRLIKNSASQVTNRNFDALNKAAGKVTGKITEASDSALVKVDNLTDKATQVVNNIEIASDKAVSKLTETTGNSISQVTNRSFDALNKATDKVTGKLTEASDSALVKVDHLTDKATQVVNNIESASDKAVSKLTETTGNSISQVTNLSFDVLNKTTEKVTGKLTEASDSTLVNISNLKDIVQNPIKFAFKSLVSSHPILTWFLRHPLLTAIVMIVVILLVLSTINMIVQLPQQLLSALLFSPLTIGIFLLGKVFKPISSVTKKSTVTTSRTAKHNQEEISNNILNKLDKIKQGQEKLTQQMDVMISSSNGKLEGMEVLREDLTQN